MTFRTDTSVSKSWDISGASSGYPLLISRYYVDSEKGQERRDEKITYAHARASSLPHTRMRVSCPLRTRKRACIFSLSLSHAHFYLSLIHILMNIWENLQIYKHKTQNKLIPEQIQINTKHDTCLLYTSRCV